MVVAPSASSAAAVAGFAHGSSTDVFRTSDAGSSPARRRSPSVCSTPRSATRNERMPSATPRRTSATAASIPATPRAAPPAAAVDERLTARVPGAARAEEQRHLDARVRTESGHGADLRVREHHHAASLRDAPHRHRAALRFLENGLENARPLDRGDLDAIAQPVREALLAHDPSVSAQNDSNASGSLGSASTSWTIPFSKRKSSTWSSSSVRPSRLPRAR